MTVIAVDVRVTRQGEACARCAGEPGAGAATLISRALLELADGAAPGVEHVSVSGSRSWVAAVVYLGLRPDQDRPDVATLVDEVLRSLAAHGCQCRWLRGRPPTPGSDAVSAQGFW